jgi:hypothetical protein
MDLACTDMALQMLRWVAAEVAEASVVAPMAADTVVAAAEAVDEEDGGSAVMGAWGTEVGVTHRRGAAESELSFLTRCCRTRGRRWSTPMACHPGARPSSNRATTLPARRTPLLASLPVSLPWHPSAVFLMPAQ